MIVVRHLNTVPHYLCLRVYTYWDFSKGEVEVNEDPIAAAVREVEEETGLDNLVFGWGVDYRETPPYRGGKVARYYVAESMNGEVYLPVSTELGRPEHHEFRWLDYPSARELIAERVRPILDWANLLVNRAA